MDVEIEDNQVAVKPRRESARARTMWGTTRSLIDSMVKGVSTGFTKSMEITGTGYRAAVQGKDLVLNLGFRHRGSLPDPGRHQDHLRTPDRHQGRRCGQAPGRPGRGRDPRLARPEPYKGKGVRYTNEQILRKEGKKK